MTARARCWIHEDCLVDLELSIACGPNPLDMQVLEVSWTDDTWGGGDGGGRGNDGSDDWGGGSSDGYNGARGDGFGAGTGLVTGDGFGGGDGGRISGCGTGGGHVHGSQP